MNFFHISTKTRKKQPCYLRFLPVCGTVAHGDIMEKQQIIDKITTKNYSYIQFIAAILYNSDDTTAEQKEALYQKYGDIIKLND